MNISEQFNSTRNSISISSSNSEIRFSAGSVKSILHQLKYKENADYENDEDNDENMCYDKVLSQIDFRKKVEFITNTQQFQSDSTLSCVDNCVPITSVSQSQVILVDEEEIAEHYENEEEVVEDYEDKENIIIEDYEVEDNDIEENEWEESEEISEDVCVLLPDCGQSSIKRRGKNKSIVSSDGLVQKNFCDADNMLIAPYRISYDFKYLPSNKKGTLFETANRIFNFGKGILSIDDSSSKIGKSLHLIELRNNVQNRCKFREIILTADEVLSNYVSGVVFADETLHRHTTEGVRFIDVANHHHILYGVKLDKGQTPLYWSENETTSVGLDNLHRRCRQYKQLGCTFATWHCVFKIGQLTPSYQAIHENSRILARYASICQSFGIVPIIEPEIILSDNHTIKKTQKITETILAIIFKTLNDYHIYLEGIILKLCCITSGSLYSGTVSSNEVSQTTLLSLQRIVPPAVAGILLVDGVQSVAEFSKNLTLIHKFKSRRTPWPITFSFDHNQLESTMRVWNGVNSKILAAQKELLKEIECLSRLAGIH